MTLRLTQRNQQHLAQCIDQGRGRQKADLVLKNAQLYNLLTGELEPSDIAICGGSIVGIYHEYQGRTEIDATGLTAVPGFFDMHLHVESSLLAPPEFERCVLPHGVTTCICDPHEIANVLGKEGIDYMLDCADAMLLDLRVRLSSCVPATDRLETSGARLNAEDLLALQHRAQAFGLAEFMNYPGVLNKDPVCLEKLCAFPNRSIDGHAPLLLGKDLNAYLSAGIANDHEATTLAEGREKLRKGMHLFMREGTITKDLQALLPLLTPLTSPYISFCTDDRNSLEIRDEGHIDHIIRQAIAWGADPLAVYRAATISAARAAGLFDKGLIAPGYVADIVLLSDLHTCDIQEVFCRGHRVSEYDFSAQKQFPPPIGLDSVKIAPVHPQDFAIPVPHATPKIRVIGAVPGKIITESLQYTPKVIDGLAVSDTERDILKVCVVERHGQRSQSGKGQISIGFCHGFGLRQGAIASTVGHDSHNLCVLGVADEDMCHAVNHLRAMQGGFVVVCGGQVLAELPLPLAGLMSLESHQEVSRSLEFLLEQSSTLGCTGTNPFLSLSFLTLSVIPELKITDKGLVDLDTFSLTSLFVDHE